MVLGNFGLIFLFLLTFRPNDIIADLFIVSDTKGSISSADKFENCDKGVFDVRLSRFDWYAVKFSPKSY